MQTTIFSSSFLLPTDRGVKAIAVENLVRIEALSNYSRLHFTDGKTLVVARVLRRFEAELQSAGFLRIHHKHLVNRRYIQSYTAATNGVVVLCNGEALGTSRRRRAVLKTLHLQPVPNTACA